MYTTPNRFGCREPYVNAESRLEAQTHVENLLHAAKRVARTAEVAVRGSSVLLITTRIIPLPIFSGLKNTCAFGRMMARPRDEQQIPRSAQDGGAGG